MPSVELIAIAEFVTSIAILLGGFAAMIREFRITRKETRNSVNGLKDQLVAEAKAGSFAAGAKSEFDRQEQAEFEEERLEAIEAKRSDND